MKFVRQNIYVTLVMAAFGVLLTSCSSIEGRNEERQLQSEVIRTLNEQTPHFAKCAKNNGLFDQLSRSRIRIELKLQINDRGQVDSFQTDSQDYPKPFVDCMFDIVDRTEFPKLDLGETLELVQPFVFKQY